MSGFEWSILIFLKILTGSELLCLGLIGGGIIALGAFAAPTMFRLLDKDKAGDTLTPIFRRFDRVIFASVGLVFLAEFAQLLLQWPAVSTQLFNPDPGTAMTLSTLKLLFRWMFVIALVAISYISVLRINPELEAMQAARIAEAPEDSEELAKFNRIHETGELFMRLESLLALGLLLFWPMIGY